MEERFVWGLEGSKRDSVSPKRREMRGGLDDQQQVQDRIFGNKKTSMHADADRNGGVICACLCSPHQNYSPTLASKGRDKVK
jgi:hypothetical protein